MSLNFWTKNPKYHDFGLGFWNEQTFESVHKGFEKTWDIYERYPEADDYDTQLNKCVYTYNSRHM